MSKFAMTDKGYMKTLEWMSEEGKLHLLKDEMSEDGFTVVALANALSLSKDLDDE
tara:strand:+ start:85 stop:249 length:165 start_codon:yes stop_codon:yes gene_type:complete